MAKKTTVEDVIDALEEAMDAARGLEVDEREEGGGKQAVVVAITEIRAGRMADAITTLEREFLPKWADRADCQVAYDRAMGRAA
jgi:hypothetical protein